MDSILIITERPNDLSEVLLKTAKNASVITPDGLESAGLGAYDAFAVLGGTGSTPLLLEPQQRNILERQRSLGKKIFIEYCASIGDYYFAPPVLSRYERLLYSGPEDFCGAEPGAILENQYCERIEPYYCRGDITHILRIGDHIRSYRKAALDGGSAGGLKNGLWIEADGKMMVCVFRLCDFIKARYSPKELWRQVVGGTVRWICGAEPDWTMFPDAYSLGANIGNDTEEIIASSIQRGLKWYEESGILRDKGKKGVYEGVRSEIDPSGFQELNYGMRADCAGESVLPYYLSWLMDGDAETLKISDNLSAHLFGNYVCRDGPLRGMVRWTAEAWTVCYQDDAVRAIMPELLRQLYTGDSKYTGDCRLALDFLVATTGTDGLRPARTDGFYLSEAELAAISARPGNCTSPNYNAYYIAALLLAYKLFGVVAYRDTALRGLDSMMAAYPRLQRIQSETHDLCRMILPLAYAFWTTGSEKHKEWLYRVTGDLQKIKHPRGAYLEWDSDHSAGLRNAPKNSESAIFAENGDPVADCLYANNWLPAAFIQAYFITGDTVFRKLWEENALFFASAQIRSDDKKTDGAWARAVDLELMEVYGIPDDCGWGPWCVESGWTMAQVISGLQMGLLEDRLAEKYR